VCVPCQAQAFLLSGRRHRTYCTGGMIQHDNINLRKTIYAKYKQVRKKFLNSEYIWKKSQYDSVRCHHDMTQKICHTDGNYRLQIPVCKTGRLKRSYNINCKMFQVDSVRDAAFGCDWVGSPITFQRCLMFIIATVNKGFQLTAGKFVPVSNLTAMSVSRINILHYFFTGPPPLVALASFVLRSLCHTQTRQNR